MPVINVRIDDVCRTWTDTLDSRMMIPGVHHVTVARTHGWWEATHLGFATLPQIRQLVEHLDDRSRGKWKPGKLAEGQVHVLHDASLMAPSVDDLVWDGESERVEIDRPPFDGLPCPLVKYSHRFILAKDATIIEDDWLDVCITCIEPSTTTSSEEALHGNGTTSFPFRSDKKSLMCLKRLATFRGI